MCIFNKIFEIMNKVHVIKRMKLAEDYYYFIFIFWTCVILSSDHGRSREAFVHICDKYKNPMSLSKLFYIYMFI